MGYTYDFGEWPAPQLSARERAECDRIFREIAAWLKSRAASPQGESHG